jgi:uncharacterized membrane protein YhaH (DUF805 family)
MFAFNRRINRLTFIAAYALIICLAYILSWIIERLPSGLSTTLDILIGLALVIYAVRLIRTRANDITGNHALLLTIAAILTPAFIALLVWPGENHANRYGKEPVAGISLK